MNFFKKLFRSRILKAYENENKLIDLSDLSSQEAQVQIKRIPFSSDPDVDFNFWYGAMIGYPGWGYDLLINGEKVDGIFHYPDIGLYFYGEGEIKKVTPENIQKYLETGSLW